MSIGSKTPERDDLWAKYDGLTPALAVELLVLAAKLECERDLARAELANARKDRDIWKRKAIGSEVET
jgi:hypothetical protein